MNAKDFLNALNDADDAYVWQAGHAGKTGGSVTARRGRRLVLRALLAAVIVIALAATVYGIGELIGIWNDRWLQTPAPDPEQVVREAVSRQIEKDYAIPVTVEEIRADAAETRKIFSWEPDSVLALRSGYGPKPAALEGKQLAEVQAVYARYTVVYDHTKTFYRDGTLDQYFYLVQTEDGNWVIFDSSDTQELPLNQPDGGGSCP